MNNNYTIKEVNINRFIVPLYKNIKYCITTLIKQTLYSETNIIKEKYKFTKWGLLNTVTYESGITVYYRDIVKQDHIMYALYYNKIPIAILPNIECDYYVNNHLIRKCVRKTTYVSKIKLYVDKYNILYKKEIYDGDELSRTVLYEYKFRDECKKGVY